MVLGFLLLLWSFFALFVRIPASTRDPPHEQRLARLVSGAVPVERVELAY
jgi:hypothetical protein